MNKCDNVPFAGWGSCAALMEAMNGGVLQEKGATAWTDASAISLAAWSLVLRDDDAAIRNAQAVPVLSFVNNTNEAEILESPLGKKSLGVKPTPSGIIYLDASICDYNHLYGLEDTWYEFIPFFQGNKFWMTRKSDQTLKGFRCKLGFVGGMPPEDKNTSYPMYIFFDDYSEFETVVPISPDFKYSDILDYVPAGLEVIPGTYTSSAIPLQINKRGSGDPFAVGVIASFKVLKSNATPTVVVTVLDDTGAALGAYGLTIQKDNDGTPADLDATDWVQMQVDFSDGSNTTFLSASFKFVGGA